MNFYHNIGFKIKYLKILNSYYDLNNFRKYINIERLNNYPLDMSEYKTINILNNIFRFNNE